MVNEKDILKAFVKLKNSNNKVDFFKVCDYLKISDLDLLEYVKDFKTKGYITAMTLNSCFVTPKLHEALKEKSFIKNFSKSLRITIREIVIAIISAIAGSIITAIFFSN